MKTYALLLVSILLHIHAIGQKQTDAKADRMVLLQRSYGGWSKFFDSKKVDYDHAFSQEEIRLAQSQKDKNDATIDNNATSTEIRYLVQAYQKTQNPAYLLAVQKGIDYLLKAQYANGGWPQYFPDTSLYRTEITFNDNAIVNVLLLMQDLATATQGFQVLDLNYREKAETALKKGLDCIVKTQVILNGKKTIWAAQYDKDTLLPAKARAYELPSLATSESSGILLFLMAQNHPDEAMRNAIEAGISWFNDHKIVGKAFVTIDDPTKEEGKDRVVVDQPGSVIWARFYDLEQQAPLFVGRDSQAKKQVADIELERRTGYAWYGNWGVKLEKAYQVWKQQIR